MEEGGEEEELENGDPKIAEITLNPHPAHGMISEVVCQLKQLETNSETWRTHFKIIPKEVKAAHKYITTELDNFPASKAYIMNHGAVLTYNVTEWLQSWVLQDNKGAEDKDDNFQEWDKVVKEQAETGIDDFGKPIEAPITIGGMKFLKRKADTSLPNPTKWIV